MRLLEKIGLVYINGNVHRLVLLAVSGTYFNVFEDITENIKLNDDIAVSGLIRAIKAKESLNVLKMFRKICDNYEITKITSVSSNFILKSKNQKSFLEEIYNNTGFNFVIMQPEDEAKMIYSGVINSVDVPKGLIINLAPEETNLILYNRRNIIYSKILPFGTQNLAEKVGVEPSAKDAVSKMIDYVKKEVDKIDLASHLDPETSFVGAGPIFSTVGKLARKSTHYSLDIENNYILENPIFEKVFDVVKDLGLDKTKKLKGISEDSVDTLLSGLCIAKALNETLNIERLSISGDTLREGLIYSYIAVEANDKPFSDMLGYSLENIRAFKDNKYSNTSHVYNLAVILFKQLKVIHKLSRAYVKALRIAASMYDCGKRISFDNHEKYSFNVILNSSLNGVSHKDVLLAAFTCMCQNPDNLNLSDWVKYKDILNDEDMEAVKKMGVIIKLADQLDKSKRGNVIDVYCDILGDSVILKTVVKGNADFEIMEGMKLGSTFKKVFKKYLEII